MSLSATRWRIGFQATGAPGTPVLTPPPSKSDAQRALVLERIIGRAGWSGLSDLSAMPSDVRALSRGLEVLASGGPWPQTIDCADGGAPYRFLLGQAAVTPGARVELVGTPRLGERPHGALVEALRQTLGPAGLAIEEGTPWPVRVTGASGRVSTPRFEIDGSASSQYVSSLALASAALGLREGRPWTVALRGELASAGYLALTLDWLRRAGFSAGLEQRVLRISAGAPALPRAQVPGDWSSIAYLLLLAWKTGAVVRDVDLSAPHPDREILSVLSQAGLTVSPVDGGVAVRGVARSGVRVDGAVCPDLLPTVAVLACVLPGESVLEHVEVLKAKESDRLSGIRALVAAAGGTVTLEEDALRIQPPPQAARALALSSHGDHRLAMCAGVLGALLSAELVLEGPECVGKSFPAFWRELERLGARTAVVP